MKKISLALFCVCLAGVQILAAESAVKSQVVKAGEIPSGMDAASWGKIQSQLKAEAFSFATDEAGAYTARNAEKQLEMNAGEEGFEVSYNEQSPLNLSAIGLEDGSGHTVLSAVAPMKDGRRVEYRKGLVTEWYDNRADGVEQGFTIHKATDGTDKAPATTKLIVAFNRDLNARVSDDGLNAVFCRKDTGREIYHYDGLKAWDANGRAIKCRMQNVEGRISESELKNRQSMPQAAQSAADKIENRKSKIENNLVLVLDTAGAVYPITVDPVIYGSEIILTASDGASGDKFGWSVSAAGDVALVGAYNNSTTGAVYVYERNADGTNAWGQMAKLTASDAAADDCFGYSVSVAGDVAVVGATNKMTPMGYTGAAYVFERNAGGTNAWGQVAEIIAQDGGEGDCFGKSISVAGDVVVVGASYKDSFAGAAYVYERNAGGTNAWGQVAKLTASDAVAGDYFGNSVSVAGDVLVVGARSKNSSTGAAYVFERNAGGTNAWAQVAKLTASDAVAGDYFGNSVSVAGDVAIVGINPSGMPGAAYVYERDAGGNNAWGQVKKLTASDAEADDYFGSSVSVAGGFAVVGASGKSSNAGAAYVFKRTKGGKDTWGQILKLTASDAVASDQFGASVAVAGDVIIAGAYGHNSNRGEAYVYPVSQTTKEFNQIAEQPPSDRTGTDYFGNSVSVAGDMAIVGAYYNSSSAGAAYVFERNAGGTNAWNQVARLTSSDLAPGDKFGASVSMDGDVAVVGAFQKNEQTGAAYVFERNAGGTNAWGQVIKLTGSDVGSGNRFGSSVSVAGDVVAVGANSKGAAYVFERNAGGTNAWGQVKKLAGEGGYFGQSVSIDGDVIVVGANTMTLGSYSSAGAAYVFERDAGGTNAWGQVKRLTASDPAVNDYFGGAVSVAGDAIIVGAYLKNSYTGAAYVFERDANGTNVWGQVAKLTASDAAANDYFGYSVSVAGDVAVVGAYGKVTETGAAYVYERNAGGTNAWAQTLKLTASDGAVYNDFGGAVSVAGDVIVVGASSKNMIYVFEDTFLPIMQVLGTNGAAIASREAASTAKGTDFGSVSSGVVRTNTFCITNAGLENLVISGMTTNGRYASAFTIQPSTFSIAASNSAEFTVRFAPTNTATYTAAVEMVNSSATTSYVVYLSGTVPRLSQTITFPAIEDQALTSTVRLAATASSGLTVTFTNLAGSPVSWQNATTITFTATGTVNIVARQWGNATYEAAPNVTNTFHVLAGPTPGQDGWLAIQVTPTAGSWAVTAPAGYTGPTAGTGNLAAVSAVTGQYTVSYGALSGYVAPSNNIETVTSGNTTLVAAVYLQISTNISTPTGVTATEGTYTNKIRVTWQGATNATGYEIWRSQTNDANTATRIADIPLISLKLTSGDMKGGAKRLAEPQNNERLTGDSSPYPQDTSKANYYYDDYAINAVNTYYYWVRAKTSSQISALSYAGMGYAAIGPHGASGTADIAVSDMVFLPVNMTNLSHAGTVSCRVMNNGPDALNASGVGFDFYMGTDAANMVWIGSAQSNLTLSGGSEALVILGPTARAGLIARADLSGIQTVRVTVRHLSSIYDPNPANNTTNAAGTVRIKTNGVNSIGRGLNDYDGDGKADGCLYQSVLGCWYGELSGMRYSAPLDIGNIGTGWTPVPGDYDGDGITDVAAYNDLNGQWLVKFSSGGPVFVCQYGGPEFTPAPGDIDGDAKTDPVVYRGTDGCWIGTASSRGYLSTLTQLGETGFEPVIADYDGDGKADPAVYNQAEGFWMLGCSSLGYQLVTGELGGAGYLPAYADYDGDGLTDPAVYAPVASYWQILMSGTLGTKGYYTWWGGTAGAINSLPVPADYDGDGKADLAVYYQNTGLWELFLSTQGYQGFSALFGGPDYQPACE